MWWDAGKRVVTEATDGGHGDLGKEEAIEGTMISRYKGKINIQNRIKEQRHSAGHNGLGKNHMHLALHHHHQQGDNKSSTLLELPLPGLKRLQLHKSN